jgi:hypothetical protein
VIDDPIVNEVREIRREIDLKYQNDPGKYLEHLKSIQKKYGERLVRRKPKALFTGKSKETG